MSSPIVVAGVLDFLTAAFSTDSKLNAVSMEGALLTDAELSPDFE